MGWSCYYLYDGKGKVNTKTNDKNILLVNGIERVLNRPNL
jgi:hypothetical protein